MGQSILDLRDFNFSKYIYFVTYMQERGHSITRYVDTIMPFFDHLTYSGKGTFNNYVDTNLPFLSEYF